MEFSCLGKKKMAKWNREVYDKSTQTKWTAIFLKENLEYCFFFFVYIHALSIKKKKRIFKSIPVFLHK